MTKPTASKQSPTHPNRPATTPASRQSAAKSTQTPATTRDQPTAEQAERHLRASLSSTVASAISRGWITPNQVRELRSASMLWLKTHQSHPDTQPSASEPKT
jgi:hypothetical protein